MPLDDLRQPEADQPAATSGDGSRPTVLQGEPLRQAVMPLVLVGSVHQVLPADLTGVAGENRAPQHARGLKLGSDLEALAFYLETKCSGGLTQQRYICELTRFHAWSVAICGKAVSSLDATDLRAYARFAAAPPASWCAPRAGNRSRGEDGWRPFAGPLSETMLTRAMKHVENYLRWLVDVKYLYENPLAYLEAPAQLAKASRSWAMEQGLLPKELPDPRAGSHRKDKRKRAMNQAMWMAMVQAVEQLPRGNWEQRFIYERTRWMITLATCGAARASDLVRGQMKYIYEDPAGSGRYVWSVFGKGNRTADIRLPAEAVKAWIRFNEFMGLPCPPLETDKTALLPRTRALSAQEAVKSEEGYMNSITPQRINQQLKELAEIAAGILEKQGPLHKADAQRLRKLSSHWWRHTGLTRMAENGAPARAIQAHARHSNLKTTEENYIHADAAVQHQVVQEYVDFEWSEGSHKRA